MGTKPFGVRFCSSSGDFEVIRNFSELLLSCALIMNSVCEIQINTQLLTCTYSHKIFLQEHDVRNVVGISSSSTVASSRSMWMKSIKCMKNVCVAFHVVYYNYYVRFFLLALLLQKSIKMIGTPVFAQSVPCL